MRVGFTSGMGWIRGAFRGSGRTPSNAKMRAKQAREHACQGTFFAYDNYQKQQQNQRKPENMPSRLEAHRVTAYNTSKQSENKIHDDTVARRYGFSGGLVPGVDVMAYMMHLPVAKWGRAFLDRGLIEAR